MHSRYARPLCGVAASAAGPGPGPGPLPGAGPAGPPGPGASGSESLARAAAVPRRRHPARPGESEWHRAGPCATQSRAGQPECQPEPECCQSRRRCAPGRPLTAGLASRHRPRDPPTVTASAAGARGPGPATRSPGRVFSACSSLLKLGLQLAATARDST
jgi:hypothetical protein